MGRTGIESLQLIIKVILLNLPFATTSIPDWYCWFERIFHLNNSNENNLIYLSPIHMKYKYEQLSIMYKTKAVIMTILPDLFIKFCKNLVSNQINRPMFARLIYWEILTDRLFCIKSKQPTLQLFPPHEWTSTFEPEHRSPGKPSGRRPWPTCWTRRLGRRAHRRDRRERVESRRDASKRDPTICRTRKILDRRSSPERTRQNCWEIEVYDEILETTKTVYINRILTEILC